MEVSHQVCTHPSMAFDKSPSVCAHLCVCAVPSALRNSRWIEIKNAADLGQKKAWVCRFLSTMRAARGRAPRADLRILFTLHKNLVETLCNLTLDFNPEMWYN